MHMKNAESQIKRYEPLFGAWYTDSFIGAGSLGSVFKVKREELGAVYYSALKYVSIPQDINEIQTLRMRGMNDADISSYYESIAKCVNDEALIMSKLKGHTHIVGCEDSRVATKECGIGYDIFIRMELLKSLKQHLSESNLTKADVIKLGIDICRALEICEANGVVHRGVEFDKLYISEYGDFKLGGFSAAYRRGEDFNTKRPDCGDYLPPEAFRGEECFSAGIYGLGMVMYKLLNIGRLPYLSTTSQTISDAEITYARSCRLRGDIMFYPCNALDELGDIVLRACAFMPELRYRNAVQMRMDLESLPPYVREGNCNVEVPTAPFVATNVPPTYSEPAYSTPSEPASPVNQMCFTPQETSPVMHDTPQGQYQQNPNTFMPINNDTPIIESEETVAVWSNRPIPPVQPNESNNGMMPNYDYWKRKNQP